MAKVKLTDKHMAAAHSFVRSPSHTPTDWLIACQAAGFSRAPSFERDTSQEAIRRATAELQAELAAEPESADSELLALEALLSEPNPSWPDLAVFARKVMGKIAVGSVTATPGQVTSLREIVARAEGKIGQAVEEDSGEIVHVVILPPIDSRMGPVIDLGKIAETDDEDLIPGLTLRQAMTR